MDQLKLMKFFQGYVLFCTLYIKQTNTIKYWFYIYKYCTYKPQNKVLNLKYEFNEIKDKCIDIVNNIYN